MLAAKTLLEDGATQRAFSVRIVLHLGGFEDLPEGDAHPLGNAGEIAHNRHEPSIR